MKIFADFCAPPGLAISPLNGGVEHVAQDVQNAQHAQHNVAKQSRVY